MFNATVSWSELEILSKIVYNHTREAALILEQPATHGFYMLSDRFHLVGGETRNTIFVYNIHVPG